MSSKRRVPKYISDQLWLKEFLSLSHISLTPKQLELLDVIFNNKIIIITGPPGTSKTFMMCFAAIRLLIEGKIGKVVLTKPTTIVSGSVDLGALPGELTDKVRVFANSFYQNFSEIVGNEAQRDLQDKGIIEFSPVQYMRGYTYKDSIILADEFQNYHINELMTIITRMGRGSKIVLAGDISQNDIKSKYVAVDTMIKLMDGIKETALFSFDMADNMRDPILIDIVNRYEELKANNLLPDSKNR